MISRKRNKLIECSFHRIEARFIILLRRLRFGKLNGLKLQRGRKETISKFADIFPGFPVMFVTVLLKCLNFN